MMFIVLTYDNQSTLSSFSLFLNFVRNSPVAEKALTGSTDLGLIVIKAWNSFLGYLTSSLSPQKDSFPFSLFVIGSLPVPEQFCGLHSQGLRGFCSLISNG